MNKNENVVVVDKLTPEQEKLLNSMDRQAQLASVARYNDGPAGFEAFFELVFGERLLPHAREWIQMIYKAKKLDKGTVIQAFRGSAKTTTLTIAFTAFRIGKDPYKSNLLIQVGDDIASDNSQAIADIIASNPNWKLVFPYIVPDKEKGWGKQGYEVKRVDIPYGQWRQENSTRKDPNLLGVGYKSHAIIGKRPTGLLIVDDIHDEINTSSDRELIKTEKILQGTILPTITPDSWVVFVGTPWLERDCLHFMLNTGEMLDVKTPILDENKETVWPDRFPPEAIKKLQNLSGEIEFARMYLLDLDMAKGVFLKGEWLHKFPREEIGSDWPTIFGIDYASTADRLKDKDRDYFGLSIWKQKPGGGAVLIGGYRRHLSQGEAEEFVKGQAAIYHPRQIGVESIGKGEEFYQLLLRNTTLPVRPIQHGKKGKGERFEKQMAPMFFSGRAWIIDVPNQEHANFIHHFREEWLLFPHGEHDDCLDAAYMGLICLQSALWSVPERSNELAVKKRMTANPFVGL